MTKLNQKQIQKNLAKFYNQPVAKVSLELFLSIGAVLFFAIFAIRPTLLTMSDLIKQIDDKKELDQQFSRKIAALATVQTEYLTIQNKIEALDQAIPNGPNIIYSLKSIEKIASDLKLPLGGLSISDFPDEAKQTQQKSTNTKLERKELSININVVGNYIAIREFVEALQNYRRGLMVKSITFNLEDTKSSTNLQARINLSMPYYIYK